MLKNKSKLILIFQQIEKMVLAPESLTNEEREIKDGDGAVIKKLKQMSASTQTQIDMEELTKMEQNQKIIYDFVNKNIFLKDVDKKKDLMFKLDIIERGIATFKEDIEHKNEQGKLLKASLEEMIKKGQMHEDAINKYKVNEVEIKQKIEEAMELTKKKETEYQKSMKMKEEEWQRMRLQLEKEKENKSKEDIEKIEEKERMLKDLQLMFENREEQIRTYERDKGLIEVELRKLKDKEKDLKIDILTEKLNVSKYTDELRKITANESKLLRYLYHYRHNFIMEFNEENLENSTALLENMSEKGDDWKEWIRKIDGSYHTSIVSKIDEDMKEIMDQHVSKVIHVFLISFTKKNYFFLSKEVIKRIEKDSKSSGSYAKSFTFINRRGGIVEFYEESDDPYSIRRKYLDDNNKVKVSENIFHIKSLAIHSSNKEKVNLQKMDQVCRFLPLDKHWVLTAY